ncbi:MAG TPA: phosphonate ABC transporter, permease protein PhnE [Candidatus Dormibacteraeota bacterium]
MSLAAAGRRPGGELPRPRRGGRELAGNAAGAAVILVVLAQAVHVTHFNPAEVVTGVGGIVDILHRGSPPDVTDLQPALGAAVETLDVALLGTVLAMVISVPLALCAAENTTPNPVAYYASRAVIGICRAIPDIVWALLFVTAVGLGPFPGTLGLGVHSVGILGRLYAECIEDMEMGPVHVLRVGGAGRMQVATHAVLPGVLPTLLGLTIYRFDTNLRSTIALGFVGGGGLGLQIFTTLNLFQYQKLTTLLLVMLVLILIVEGLAVLLRRRIR